MRSGKTPLSVDPPAAFRYFTDTCCNGSSGVLGFHRRVSERAVGGSGVVVLAMVGKGRVA